MVSAGSCVPLFSSNTYGLTAKMVTKRDNHPHNNGSGSGFCGGDAYGGGAYGYPTNGTRSWKTKTKTRNRNWTRNWNRKKKTMNATTFLYNTSPKIIITK
jgi:hypothetical protein